MNNVVDFTPRQPDQPFEDFIQEMANQVLTVSRDLPAPLERIKEILTEVFDEGVGMGYTMMAEDIRDMFEEVGV